jgi:hypothetical protein
VRVRLFWFLVGIVRCFAFAFAAFVVVEVMVFFCLLFLLAVCLLLCI